MSKYICAGHKGYPTLSNPIMKSSWMIKILLFQKTGKSLIMEITSTRSKPIIEYIVYQLCSSHQDNNVKYKQWGGKRGINGS